MYDLAIIGGGPAGYSAAFEAKRYGMSVVLFEFDSVGGTCLNRGCVPTKYLLHVARKYNECIESEDGILFQSLNLDYSRTRLKMESIISGLRTGLYENLKRSGVEIVTGNAAIKASGVIDCNGREYCSKSIIIATGAKSEKPIVKGAFSSDEVLNLDHIPNRMHIIGGGTISIEFAEIFRMLGSEVSISIRGERILRNWDKEISTGLTHSLKKKGVQINTGCDIQSVDLTNYDIILSAVGRRPNIPPAPSDLFDVGDNGGIVVDKHFRSKSKGLFAVGDVVEGSVQLAHTAMDQGRQVVRYISNGIEPSEGSVIKCIYPDQEAASVGITEAEAKAKGIKCVIAKQTMYANARTAISTDERGFIKVIASEKDGKIVGAHLMCEHAGEIVSEFAMAIDQEMTASDMLKTIRPHPSYCESIQDVLRVVEDRCSNEV